MNSQISHQTVRLSRGRHTFPGEGACVMELTSMLAGESFTDHPRSVCPALGAILRRYNDSLTDESRQDLYEYASRVVGTRGSRALTKERARVAFEFFAENLGPGKRAPFLTRLQCRVPGQRLAALARITARYTEGMTLESHERALGLIDRLIALGGAEGTPAADIRREAAQFMAS